MKRFKLVYKDRGSYADNDTNKGWWRIFERKWWGWKELDVSCWGLDSAKETVKRLKENQTIYMD